MTHFAELGLDPAIVHALNQMDFTEATPIQAQAIPPALEGKDVIGSAQTGTGKTAAFAIPLMSHLMNDASACALVLSPTREIAKQTLDMLKLLLRHHKDLNTAFLIGGESMGKQFAQLKRRPRIIVATPGRLNDHLQRGSVKLSRTNFLVLDETDRMLDMGFAPQLAEIFPHLAEQRQTLMFSATFPKNIVRLAEEQMVEPVRISVGSTTSPHKNIKQTVMKVSQETKFETLVDALQMRVGTAIVFVKTKYGTEKLAKKLIANDLSAEAIHGDLKQARRERTIRAFRKGDFRILVATDVVARGLDVPHVAHVVNFDLPQVAEDFIHRIGRTARAGAEGEALSLVAPQDRGKWAAIDRLINPNAKDRDRAEVRDDGDRRKSRHRKGGGFKKGGFKSRSDRFEDKRFDDKPAYEKPKRARKASNRFEGPSQADLEGGDEAKRDGFRDSFNASPKRKSFSDKSASGKPARRGKPQGERTFEERKSEGRSFEGKRKADDKKFEGKKFAGKRNSDAGKSEGRKFEGKKFEGKKEGSYGKPSRDGTEGRRRKPAGRPSGGSGRPRTQANGKPSHRKGNGSNAPRRAA